MNHYPTEPGLYVNRYLDFRFMWRQRKVLVERIDGELYATRITERFTNGELCQTCAGPSFGLHVLGGVFFTTDDKGRADKCIGEPMKTIPIVSKCPESYGKEFWDEDDLNRWYIPPEGQRKATLHLSTEGSRTITHG